MVPWVSSGLYSTGNCHWWAKEGCYCECQLSANCYDWSLTGICLQYPQYQGNGLSQSPVQLAASLSKLKTSCMYEKEAFLFHLAKQVLGTCTINDTAITFRAQSDTQDYVSSYAWVLCHFGSLITACWDAWVEGDGDWNLICLKVFTFCFHDVSSRSNSIFQSVRLLILKELLPRQLLHDPCVESVCKQPWWEWQTHTMRSVRWGWACQ